VPVPDKPWNVAQIHADRHARLLGILGGTP
jgi:hypothetical protein